MIEINKMCVRRFYAHVTKDGLFNPDALTEFYARDCLFHDLAPEPNGLEGLMQTYGDVFNCTGLSFDLLLLVAEADLCADRWRVQFVHTEPILGMKPTGNRCSLTGMQMCRFENGKVVERWNEMNLAALVPQLEPQLALV